MLDPAKETVIRDFLVNKAQVTLPSLIVLRTRRLYASPEDFATRNSQTYTKNYKCNYLMISWAGFRDDPTKGCDDDPVVYPTYLFQLYRDSVEEKNNKPNSHDELVRDSLLLREAFLNNRSIVSQQIEHNALIQVGDMVKVQPCEHIVNTAGDWINFRLTVDVNS